MRKLLLTSSILFSNLLFASESQEVLFLKDVPATCKSAVEEALMERKWLITKNEDEKINATIHGNAKGVTVQIEIYYKDGSFYSKSSATKMVRAKNGPGKQTTRETETDIPKNWFINLQSDAVRMCKTRSYGCTDKEEKSLKQRLSELEELKESELISQDEYQKQRQKILDSI